SAITGRSQDGLSGTRLDRQPGVFSREQQALAQQIHSRRQTDLRRPFAFERINYRLKVLTAIHVLRSQRNRATASELTSGQLNQIVEWIPAVTNVRIRLSPLNCCERTGPHPWSVGRLWSLQVSFGIGTSRGAGPDGDLPKISR